MHRTGLENYHFENGRVIRELRLGARAWRSGIENQAVDETDGYSAWWQSFLRGASIYSEAHDAEPPPIRIVDAFCGCGGLTLGAAQAAIAVGRRVEVVAAIDVDDGGLQVHQANFMTKRALHTSASSLVDFHVSGTGTASKFAYEPEIIDAALAAEIGHVDLFLAGPAMSGPFESQQQDAGARIPRNLLYLTAVALAVGLKAKMVVIENVPEVVNDRSDVVTAAKALSEGKWLRLHGQWRACRPRDGLGTDAQTLLPNRCASTALLQDHLTLKGVATGLKREAFTALVGPSAI
jgi:DNA (cytosine-5)-methyltransferase 1